jgi:hypothetical protein
MKKQFKMGVVALLAMVGLVLLASEPSEGVDWFANMFWKALAGLSCWCVSALLYKRWNLQEDEK